MYPLSQITKIDVSKTTFFKFGDILSKGKLIKKTYASTISPKVTTTGKYLINVTKKSYFFL